MLITHAVGHAESVAQSDRTAALHSISLGHPCNSREAKRISRWANKLAYINVGSSLLHALGAFKTYIHRRTVAISYTGGLDCRR